MRLTRLLASLFALAVMTATPLVAVTTADAGAAQPGIRDHHAASVEKAKKRKVSIKFAANGASSFRLSGKVSPKGKHVKIALFYSKSGHGKFTSVKKAKTGRTGTYVFTGLKKTGYYGVVAAPSKGFKISASKIVKVSRH